MAQQCYQNEYFDRLLIACKPCRLRCSNTPPVTCQHYCNTSNLCSVTTVKGTNVILWTCLGLSLIVSLTVFILMFLLRKRSSGPLRDELRNPGWFDFDGPSFEILITDLTSIHEDAGFDPWPLSVGLEYTVEECTCEDCVQSEPKVDSDHFFPLPAMEEGATILVTTKTNGYCSSLLAAESALALEKSISTR
uniref:TNF receptor superfamily member 17 n=1 Tax=Sus scrofa TaxID=9823 RepID=A0A8W4FCJ9_PIG